MEKSIKAKNYHHGDLRNALLRVAAELVVTHGVEGFSLREAARRIGVTPTACYRHFADKAALLKAVAMDGFSELAQRMESESLRVLNTAGIGASDSAKAKQHFTAIGQAYVNFAVENSAQFRVMFGPYGAGGNDSVRGVSSQSGKDSYEIFVEALDALVDCGAVDKNARMLAELPAWASIHGLAALFVDGMIRIESERALTAMTDNVIHHILMSMGFADN